jgi:hypothetical protein
MWPSLVNIQYTELSFPHDNFSSVYWIFTKLGHRIPLWKGKNHIYFGVIRAKVKVTITINRISKNIFIVMVTLTFDPKINKVLPLPQGNHVVKIGKDPIYRTKVVVWKPTGSFPHNFSSVHWIFTKLDHMIPLWKGRTLFIFGVIRLKVMVTVTINISKLN